MFSECHTQYHGGHESGVGLRSRLVAYKGNKQVGGEAISAMRGSVPALSHRLITLSPYR